jgi:hypothetical protein
MQAIERRRRLVRADVALDGCDQLLKRLVALELVERVGARPSLARWWRVWASSAPILKASIEPALPMIAWRSSSGSCVMNWWAITRLRRYFLASAKMVAKLRLHPASPNNQITLYHLHRCAVARARAGRLAQVPINLPVGQPPAAPFGMVRGRNYHFVGRPGRPSALSAPCCGPLGPREKARAGLPPIVKGAYRGPRQPDNHGTRKNIIFLV